MKPFALVVLIGVLTVLGFAEVFLGKILLSLISKPLVILFLSIINFLLVMIVIRINSRLLIEK